MLELNEANSFIFRRSLVKISIIIFFSFILSAILIYPPSASFAQSVHTCMEDIFSREGEDNFFYCGSSQTGQFMCLSGYSSTYDLECHAVSCPLPDPGEAIFSENCQYDPAIDPQKYSFFCNEVTYGGSSFNCMGPYT
jgi:hypothetical protein